MARSQRDLGAVQSGPGSPGRAYGGGAVQPPAQTADIARHGGPGVRQTQAGRRSRDRWAIEASGAKVDRAGPVNMEGLDPAGCLAVEGQTQISVARRCFSGGEAGGRRMQINPRTPVAVPDLQVGIGQVADHGRPDRLAGEAGQARASRRSRDAQGDAIARRGQIDRGLQPSRFGVPTLEGRRRHPGRQPHQLAVIDAGVAEDVGRAVVGVEPDPRALNQNQWTPAVGTGGLAGEALDQRIQRAEGQFAVPDAGAHHRADQSDTGGCQADPSLRPGRAEGVIDLDPFDGDVRVCRVADPDTGCQTVQLQPIDLHVGLNALLLQPADQDLSRRGTAVEVEQGRQDKQDAEYHPRDPKGAPAPGAHRPQGGRSGIGRSGHGPVITAQSRRKKGR